MSKGSLFWGNATGKLGETVFYRTNGEQRNRTYLRQIRNPRSLAQMRRRIKFPNLVNFWRVARPIVAMAMQTRRTAQSDYNKFISLNLANNNTYLLKSEAAAGATAVAPYQITAGTLPTIGMRSPEISNIRVGELSGSVSAVSAAILTANPSLQNGDMLSFVVFGQTIDNAGLPRVVANAFKFKLDVADVATDFDDSIVTVGDIAPSVSDNYLSFEYGSVEYDQYAAAVILSRPSENGWEVSTEWLALERGGFDPSQSVSGVSENDALASYGYSPEAFLNPGSEAAAGADIPRPSITAVRIGGEAVINGGELSKSYGNQTLNITGKNLSLATVEYDAVTVSTTGDDAAIEGNLTLKQGEFPLVIKDLTGAIIFEATIDGLMV